MRWWQKMRALFSRARPGTAATAAVAAANESHRKAVDQRDKMALLRAEADEVTAAIKAHNAANRYDDFLARVIRGEE